jgi:hypothetical protein
MLTFTLTVIIHRRAPHPYVILQRVRACIELHKGGEHARDFQWISDVFFPVAVLPSCLRRLILLSLSSSESLYVTAIGSLPTFVNDSRILHESDRPRPRPLTEPPLSLTVSARWRQNIQFLPHAVMASWFAEVSLQRCGMMSAEGPRVVYFRCCGLQSASR